jgi:poly(3-hydroxyoctanoate) depolymerase
MNHTIRGIAIRVARSMPHQKSDERKPPLLLLNGVWAPGSIFRPLQEAITRPTITASVLPYGFMTVEQYAHLIADLIADLGLDRVDILGVSWGGALAQTVARYHPQHVRKLVLAATVSDPTTLSSRDFYDSYATGDTGGSDMRENPAALRYLEGESEGGMLGDMWRAMALLLWASTPWIAEITHPVLIMAGENDRLTPLAGMERMARLMPRAVLHREPGAGHCFICTRARAVAPVIDAFLDGGERSVRSRKSRGAPVLHQALS